MTIIADTHTMDLPSEQGQWEYTGVDNQPGLKEEQHCNKLGVSEEQSSAQDCYIFIHYKFAATVNMYFNRLLKEMHNIDTADCQNECC